MPRAIATITASLALSFLALSCSETKVETSDVVVSIPWGDHEEAHYSLVDREGQILTFIAEIGLPGVRINYDTGNAWYYAKGALDPVKELDLLAPVVAHVHLKTPRIDNGLLRWVALGEGALDLPAAARVLRERLPGVPVSYELSPRQRSRDFEPRWRAPEVPPLAELRETIRRSLVALERVLG